MRMNMQQNIGALSRLYSYIVKLVGIATMMVGNFIVNRMKRTRYFHELPETDGILTLSCGLFEKMLKTKCLYLRFFLLLSAHTAA